MAMAVRLLLVALLASVLTGCAAPWSKPPVGPEIVGPETVGADCGAGPLVASSETDALRTVEARELVRAFIADFHEAWERAGRPGSTFEEWDAELAALAAAYLVGGTTLGDEGALSSNPSHDPDEEVVTGVGVTGDTASVRTALLSPQSEYYYDYRLRRVAGAWRIERLIMTMDPPTAPVMDPAKHDALLADVSAETVVRHPSGGSGKDLAALFEPPFTVAELGSIRTSGVMTVHDFGWVHADLAPFEQRVPPGTYPVSVSRRADGTNMALHLELADLPASRWIEADRVGFDNIISVDAGNVALLDFTTMPPCRIEWLEELYQDRIAGDQWPSGTVFSVAGDVDDAAFVTSGYGDGGYPAYWGVAADGTITDLVVDFLVSPVSRRLGPRARSGRRISVRVPTGHRRSHFRRGRVSRV
jgi:hypothetical protein